MTEKQKIIVAVGVFLLIVAFVFIYRQFSMQGRTGDSMGTSSRVTVPTPPPGAMTPPSGTGAHPTSVPQTPDGVSDEILKNESDMTLLDEEEAGESAAAGEEGKTIDDITTSYEEQSL